MPLFEVEKILKKSVDGRKHSYFIQWKNYKRASWVLKEDLDCNKLLLDFELSIGPKILGKFSYSKEIENNYPLFYVYEQFDLEFLISGAKRERNGIKYLIIPKDDPNGLSKVVPAVDVKMFAVPIIFFLQSKIIFDENSSNENRENLGVIDASISTPHKVVCKCQ